MTEAERLRIAAWEVRRAKKSADMRAYWNKRRRAESDAEFQKRIDAFIQMAPHFDEPATE